MKTYLQKKLTGLPGQVVGFDEQGQAEAQYPKGGFVAQLQVTVMRGEASGAVTLTAVCGARRVEQVIPEGSSRTVLEISAYGLWTVTAQAQTGQLLRPSREIRVDTVRQYPVLLGGFEELGKNPPAVIREACENGLARSYWKVGDSISIPLSDGGTAVMQIYDYDHDTLAQGGRALITFGSKYLVNESLHHNAPLTLRTTNERGWSSSGIRNYLKGEFWGGKMRFIPVGEKRIGSP